MRTRNPIIADLVSAISDAVSARADGLGMGD